jgi:hypothetical protein
MRGGILPASTPHGFLPWTLSDDGLGACRTVAIGRRPKPFTHSDVIHDEVVSQKLTLLRVECLKQLLGH